MKHEKIETRVGLLIGLTLFAVSIGGMVEIFPLVFDQGTKPIETVKPYSPLALDYVDGRATEASYSPGASDENALLKVVITGWDDRMWKSHARLVIDADVWLLDAGRPSTEGGGQLLGPLEGAAPEDRRPGTVAHHLPGRDELRGHVRELELDALELGDGHAELLARLEVLHGLLQRCIHRAGRLRAAHRDRAGDGLLEHRQPG